MKKEDGEVDGLPRFTVEGSRGTWIVSDPPLSHLRMVMTNFHLFSFVERPLCAPEYENRANLIRGA